MTRPHRLKCSWWNPESKKGGWWNLKALALTIFWSTIRMHCKGGLRQQAVVHRLTCCQLASLGQCYIMYEQRYVNQNHRQEEKSTHVVELGGTHRGWCQSGSESLHKVNFKFPHAWKGNKTEDGKRPIGMKSSHNLAFEQHFTYTRKDIYMNRDGLLL